jgi:hypothetical protein
MDGSDKSFCTEKVSKVAFFLSQLKIAMKYSGGYYKKDS